MTQLTLVGKRPTGQWPTALGRRQRRHSSLNLLKRKTVHAEVAMGNVTCFKRIDYRLWLYEMSDLQTFPNPQHSENALVERGASVTHCGGIEDWAIA